MAILGKAMNLQPEERSAFRSLFLLSLITGIGLSYYFVAVNTFLIQKTSVSNLPFAYIISGLGGVLLIRIYQLRQRKAGIIRSYGECVAAFFVVALTVFFAYEKWGDDPKLAVYLAYFGFLFNMPFTIMFALSFSAICSRIFNLAQSKRLLALVGTGEIVASIAGYLSAPLIGRLAGGPTFLLPVAAIAILPAFFPIRRLYAENKTRLAHVVAAKAKLQKLGLAFFTRERFFLLIAGVSIFSVAAVYFVDYSYLITVRFMSSYSGIEIATIVGVFFSLVKAGELIFSFLSGYILSAKGVKFSILLLPLLLSGCFIFAAVGGVVFTDNPVFILSFIFLAKFAERVVRKAISTPAIKVLYQVTGPDRLRIEATIEGLLNQAATVLSGVLLLIVSRLLSGNDPSRFLAIVSVICFVLFLLWSFVSLKLYESYKKKVWQYLTEIRGSGETVLEKADRPVYALTDGGLLSGEPQWPVLLDEALIKVDRLKTDRDLKPLGYYSPALQHLSVDDMHLLNRKLASSYFVSDNFFYRLSVIRFFESESEKFTLRLFRECWDISDLLLKKELITLFNTHGEEPAENDQFYFEDICQEYSDELIYAFAAQYDLRDLEDAELYRELKAYIDLLVQVLFELLKVLYDRSAIQVIYEIITSDEHQDIESKLFAIELLDNTLNDSLKQKFIPIFEPAPFDQKIHRLQQFVPVSFESREERLKGLLMKDFTLVNPRLRELCLDQYFILTKDERVLSAFRASTLRNLRERAVALTLDEDEGLAPEPVHSSIVPELEKTYALNRVQLTYLYNQGIHLLSGRKDRKAVVIKGQSENPYFVTLGNGAGGFVLDAYAVALLINKN